MSKHVAAAIALLATPVALMSACSNQAGNNPSTSTTSSTAAGAGSLTTQLNTSDGKHVANATVDFTSGYATVTVETTATGILSPGFHGLRVLAVGKCDADSVAPTSGLSGDLPPLLARSDGAGKLVATSDGFTQDQLKGPDGSSIVVTQGAQGTPESDQRIACGVLSPASTTSTSVSVSTSTSTVTTSAATPVPPATVTETTSSTPVPSSTSTSASTSTSTVTVIQPPTIPPITVPQLPGPNGG